MSTTTRRDENRFELYAAVNLKQTLRSMYCTIYATDRHEALCAVSLCDSRATCILCHSQPRWYIMICLFSFKLKVTLSLKIMFIFSSCFDTFSDRKSVKVNLYFVGDES